jgi:hypothetical protein
MRGYFRTFTKSLFPEASTESNSCMMIITACLVQDHKKLVVPQQGEVWWNNKGNRGVDKQMMW